MTALLLGLSLTTVTAPGITGSVSPGQAGPPEPITATAWAWVVTDSTGAFYIPREEDFRPRYRSDRNNQERQDWTAYWNWVQVFYRGNLFSAGWTRECERLLKQGEDGLSRDERVRRLNVLGRLIAAEWAKDNHVRRLDTADVRRWGRSLEKAAREGRLETGLAEVEREVTERYRIPRTGAEP